MKLELIDLPSYMTKAEQFEPEFEQFIAILKRENVKSYLEIGSKNGGSLWRVANALPKGSCVVSVDLPHGDGGTKQSLVECCGALDGLGYRVHLFLNDSTDLEVINAVKNHGPFDACFIDANHTEPYVRQDWANYGPMCRIVAFHDIAWKKEKRVGRLPIEVPKVWDEIKASYRYEEISLRPDDNGIGVLWRR